MNKYIGDKKFYRKTFAVLLPIIIQNVITNFVSLLDNIMVGKVGTEPMSGVAIVNQLLFVFNLAVFGMISGAGIYGAQFHGKGDAKGVAHTIKFKLLCIALLLAGAYGIFFIMGDNLIWNFLHESEAGLDLDATFHYGKTYMNIMLIQLVPFALNSIFSGTLRETGNSQVPMKAGVAAVLVNLVFNYILIYGKFGAPALGVNGAAIATVLSRFVEIAIILGWILTHIKENPFVPHLLKWEKLPGGLVKQMIITGTPMFFNEFLWSAGITTLNQLMSLRGLEIVSALNISSTVTNLFSAALFACGNALSIIVGQTLGSGDMEKAVDEDRKMITLAFLLNCAIAAVMIIVAPYVPNIYNTIDLVRDYAATFIRISSVLMPMNAVIICCYFTLRSGGKTIITFLFDSFYTWVWSVSLAYVLTHFTNLPIIPIYTIIYASDAVKLMIGLWLVKSRSWVNNLVADK